MTYSVGETVWIAQPLGWRSQDVIPFTVQRVTPSGQCVIRSQSNPDFELRLNGRGRIVGAGAYDRRQVVTAATAAEIRRENRLTKLARTIVAHAEAVEKAARQEDDAAIAEAFGKLASAIEARRAAAENTDAVHESATRQGDAQ